jgi:hypothetical protein
MREGPKPATVTKLSLKLAQNRQKSANSKKIEIIDILRLAKGFS